MDNNNFKNSLLLALVGVVLAGCQSSGSGQNLTQNIGAQQSAPLQQASLTNGENAIVENNASTSASPRTANEVAFAGQSSQSPAICAIRLAAGPPAIPARGKDFGKAVASNLKKDVGRRLLTNLGARLGGGIGARVAGGIANTTIRNEEDIKGVWTITDTSRNCGCSVAINGLFVQKGKGTDSGTAKPKACANPHLNQMAHWSLGWSFTGYDAKFELKARDKRTVIATFNRDGIHYFSGRLADGTPVVMWRDKNNYAQLRKQ